MSGEILTLVLFGSMLVALAMGIPLTFLLGGLAMLFTVFMWGSQSTPFLAHSVMAVMQSQALVAAPMFILMGFVLEKSGIADDLFKMMYQWLGPLRGGLAVGVVVICTIVAAMVGSSAAGTLTMGLIALPAMLKRRYDKKLAIGTIAAGGALGILIPPSIPMVFYGFMASVSIGQLFMGGVFPGLLLAGLFSIYILIACRFRPQWGPPVPSEEIMNWREKFLLVRALILPLFIVFAVLGTLFLGIASPMESSAMGAFGSLACAAIKGKFNWTFLKEVAYETTKLCGMAMWILLGSSAFTTLYAALGGQQVASHLINTLGLSPWQVIIGTQIILFLLGMIMDPLGILMITIPVFAPIVKSLGFSVVWFGVLFTVNMEMGYLTPPFGWNLFYMRSVVPREQASMGDIYRSIVPFVALQAIGLILCMVFPEIILWLPSKMFK